jgi:uncharacterized protein with GYD domain
LAAASPKDIGTLGDQQIRGNLMGEWDVLLITEFPDEKSAMRALVATCQSGMGTTQTMTALPLEEFVQLGHPS